MKTKEEKMEESVLEALKDFQVPEMVMLSIEDYTNYLIIVQGWTKEQVEEHINQLEKVELT